MGLRIAHLLAASAAIGVTAQAQAALPLLDQAAVRSPIMAGCAGKSDAALLPVDPRRLVTPAVNRNPTAAVRFNSFFTDLHNPTAPWVRRLPARPRTCGEFRASIARGKRNLEERQYFLPFSKAADYDRLWAVWGYSAKPADFDEQVAKRYGFYPAPFRNPYPLPGEDPNATNGGSGQLPIGLIQGKGDDGKWTGTITASCSACHDSRLGSTSEAGFTWGLANSANDAGLLASDLYRSSPSTWYGLVLPIPWSVGRGSTDAIGLITLLPALFDMETLQMAPSVLEYTFDTPAGGMTKAPNWFNRGFKTRQFWDGSLTSDNVHSEMAFGVASTSRSATQRRALEGDFEDINNFLLSMSAPRYPGAINRPLAEQGAVIFHERDLWGDGANADIPREPGNGSCASCHGVYSPRYAADTRYLPDPRLKGVPGNVTPIETIQTDPRRYNLFKDQRQRRAWNSSWWAYNSLNPTFYGYPAENIVASELRRVYRAIYNNGGPVFSPLGPNEWVDPQGYVSPPLYGAWASGPFLHNGSVPDVWGVLKPSERPTYWRRPFTEPGQGGKNQGFDYSYASYDFGKLGWKYQAVDCDGAPTLPPYEPCSNGQATPDQLYSAIANGVAGYLNLGYQSPPPITDQQVRSRMTYNSNLYGNGNGGHTFTQSLTDAERVAIIEYLKTL